MAGEEYRKVVLTFWTDPDVKRPLTRDQKLLLLYFCTSPHSNMAGVYYCPLAYAANETGIPIDEVRAYTMGALAGFLTYDEQTEEVFVHGLAKHNIGAELKPGDNRIKGVEKLVEAIHSTRLSRAFLARYSTTFHLNLSPPDDRIAPSEAPSKPLASPFEAIAVAVTEHSRTEQSNTFPTGTGEARQEGLTRGQLLGLVRKCCAPRKGKVSEADMVTNASVVDTIAGRGWTYAKIGHAVIGTQMRRDRGEIGCIPAGAGWTLKYLLDATPDVDPLQVGLNAYHEASKPPPEERRKGSTATIGDVLDFSKFAKGA